MIDLRPTHHHAIFRPSHVPAMRWPARWKYPPRIRLRLLRSWHGRQLDFKKVVCKRGFRPSSIGFRQTQLRFSPRACPWNACGLRGGSIRRAFVCASRAHGTDGSLISRKLYASRGRPGSIGFRQTRLRFSSCACPCNAMACAAKASAAHSFALLAFMARMAT